MLIIEWKLKREKQIKIYVEDLPKILFSAITKQRKGILEFKEKVFQIWYSHFHIKGHKESRRSSIYQLLVPHKAWKRAAAIINNNNNNNSYYLPITVLIALMLVTIQIELNRVKNPNWPQANQLAIYKRGRGFELAGLPWRNQASGQSGTWTRGLRIIL